MQDDAESIYDALLVMKCRRGDGQAWRELVQRYERRLLYFIRRLVGSERDAYDILQQTWLGAIKGIARLTEPRFVRTWLYRIARNNAVTHLRRHGAELDCVELGELQEQIPEAEDDGWPIDAAERVHVAMSKLSVPHREVLALYFLEDASVEEIAEVTGTAAGTVKSRLFYARRALRSEIEKQESP